MYDTFGCRARRTNEMILDKLAAMNFANDME